MSNEQQIYLLGQDQHTLVKSKAVKQEVSNTLILPLKSKLILSGKSKCWIVERLFNDREVGLLLKRKLIRWKFEQINISYNQIFAVTLDRWMHVLNLCIRHSLKVGSTFIVVVSDCFNQSSAGCFYKNMHQKQNRAFKTFLIPKNINDPKYFKPFKHGKASNT